MTVRFERYGPTDDPSTGGSPMVNAPRQRRLLGSKPEPPGSRISTSAPTPAPAPSPKRPWSATVKWFVGVFLAAFATLIGGVITGIPAQLFSSSAVKDSVRTGQDMDVRIIQQRLDNLLYVVPEAYAPSADVTRAMSRPQGVLDPKVASFLQTRGVPIGNSILQLALTGRRAEEIRITDIEPIIERRDPPMDGTLFNFGGQGELPDVQMALDLDAGLPHFTEAGGAYGSELLS